MVVEANNIYNCDNKEGMKALPDKSIDVIITDPPYALVYENYQDDKVYKKGVRDMLWDAQLPTQEFFNESYRALKNGSYMLAMASPRQDVLYRVMQRMENAGFNIAKQSLYWVYQSGFPKNADYSGKIDKRKGLERDKNKPYPMCEESKFVDGWHSFGLKPTVEVIVVGQKQMNGNNVDHSLNFYKNLKEADFDSSKIDSCIGGINVEDCRIPYADGEKITAGYENGKYPSHLLVQDNALGNDFDKCFSIDRWFDKLVGGLSGKYLNKDIKNFLPFLKCSKASIKEKDTGLDDVEDKECIGMSHYGEGWGGINPDGSIKNHKVKKNDHDTVKPVKLMCWLVTLMTMENMVVLDPFMGSGTTALACIMLNRKFIGFEQDPKSYNYAQKRARYWIENYSMKLFNNYEDFKFNLVEEKNK